ncbi:MAG: glutamine-hydrolyzing carbamoyl-phosphate synthase small subunit [Bacillota bacterium]|nr:glutamine-hydrolyzing carbamoyl-phosphate synthase small subunit [Bacillota bacterium]
MSGGVAAGFEPGEPGGLLLASGELFLGRLASWPAEPPATAWAASDEAIWGEGVFNTSMTGYQEVLTDPSYAGQVVVMTYPFIGHYGLSPEADQALEPAVAGFVAGEFWREPDRGSGEEIVGWLRRRGVPALEGVATRKLAVRLREGGDTALALVRGRLLARLERLRDPAERVAALSWPARPRDLVARVVRHGRLVLGRGDGRGPRVAVLDLGTKRRILDELLKAGASLELLPWNATAAEILASDPDGLVVTNGPGDPADLPGVEAALRQVAGRLPTWGICLGHQVLAAAFGARTGRLPYGHRGGNHPVQEVESGRAFITAQNHGYAVLPEELPDELEVTHVELNDGVVEGLRHRRLPVWSVQFHPEGAPGPLDSRSHFREFVARVAAWRGLEVA